MTPDQFVHCRKQILSLDQSKLADMLGLHYRQIRRYERGITPIPPRIAFAMAWIVQYGDLNPWAAGGGNPMDPTRTNGSPAQPNRVSDRVPDRA